MVSTKSKTNELKTGDRIAVTSAEETDAAGERGKKINEKNFRFCCQMFVKCCLSEAKWILLYSIEKLPVRNMWYINNEWK